MHKSLKRLSTCLLLVMAGLASCASSGAPSNAASPEEEAAVIGVVQTFFDAMAARDVEAASAILVPEGVFVSISGERGLGSFDNASWLSRLAGRRSELLETIVGTPVVLISGDVAMVWTDYSFAIDGEASHTGVDAFTLVKTDGAWKIAGGAYSMIFEDAD